jgi:hypothetical protein
MTPPPTPPSLPKCNRSNLCLERASPLSPSSHLLVPDLRDAWYSPFHQQQPSSSTSKAASTSTAKFPRPPRNWRRPSKASRNRRRSLEMRVTRRRSAKSYRRSRSGSWQIWKRRGARLRRPSSNSRC